MEGMLSAAVDALPQHSSGVVGEGLAGLDVRRRISKAKGTFESDLAAGASRVRRAKATCEVKKESA